MSNTILGDLSYKTAGSQYKQSGVFEVVKAEAEDAPAAAGGPSTSTGGDGEGTSGTGTGEGQKSSLKVGKLYKIYTYFTEKSILTDTQYGL